MLSNESPMIVFLEGMVPSLKRALKSLCFEMLDFDQKVKLQCFRFFLHTVTRPNESKHACCQTNLQKSFFRLVHRTCALAYIKYLKNEKQMCQYFQKHPV